MSRMMPRLGGMAVLCGAMLVASTAVVRAEGPTADQLFAELQALKYPDFDITRRDDREYFQKAVAEAREIGAKRAEKINAFAKDYPDDPRLAKLMPELWQDKLGSPEGSKAVRSELDGLIVRKSNPALVKQAGFFRAMITMMESGTPPNPDVSLKAIDEYQKLVGNDDLVASLIYQLATSIKDKGTKKELTDRIARDFAGTKTFTRMEGARRQEEAIGKPFELEFTDAIKGSPVSIKGLKGKVVVIDFWATWCGPCVAEMPKMKKLYAEYKDKGVEFIGVSLDKSKEEGGLDKLKAYVEKNDIQWPQYYQGDYWDSEFSMNWGVSGIPCVFLVDADGNLASVDARGKLEELIPEYLKKAHADIK